MSEIQTREQLVLQALAQYADWQYSSVLREMPGIVPMFIGGDLENLERFGYVELRRESDEEWRERLAGEIGVRLKLYRITESGRRLLEKLALEAAKKKEGK